MRLRLIGLIFWFAAHITSAHAAQFVINGPVGSGEFGRTVTTLPNGNIVVTDPAFDAPGPIADVGAVYLYRPNGVLISTLRGSLANDRVGSGGVVVLANGNFVVVSPNWRNGVVADASAVTFALATTGSGISSVVSPENSLVGSSTGDQLGSAGVTTLANGNYVVRSPLWDNSAIVDAGAATFGSGTSGVVGAVTPGNSLVGTTAQDRVGITGVTGLTNGNYVVGSAMWDNGAIVDAGAATFGSGTTGVFGVILPANSLVGSSTADQVGGTGVTALTNGNYVVRSQFWDHGAVADAGAVTFGSGAAGVIGVISPVNSLVGSLASDRVGISGVTALANGNYVVASSLWDNGPIANAGAATFASGTVGIAGVITPINSLVGSSALDQVGSSGVTALANGNYVVRSPTWDNGPVVDAGAVAFASGTSGISGVVSPANSLVGSTTGDLVGISGVTALSNGNYVVGSQFWDDGAVSNVGAATFGSGTSGIIGAISPANSLVGSTTEDRVGTLGAIALSNGNYVVRSQNWRNGSLANAGAVTFGAGTTGVVGSVSPANSLVGSSAGDLVGSAGVIALANGDYVVGSTGWDNGAFANVGAATYGSGTSGITGIVSPANSIVGSTLEDRIGGSVTALSNGNFVVQSVFWSNGALISAGAVTLGLSGGSVVGAITSTHSVLGLVAIEGTSQVFSYDAVRNQLAVGQRRSNRVVLQRTGFATAISIVGDAPDPSFVGQPVTFTATVSASPSAPADGRVTFTASSGESCVDTTPTPTSATTADYACAITFTASGTSTVIAEYTGSTIHAYSGSAAETHTTIVDPVFADGFEAP